MLATNTINIAVAAGFAVIGGSVIYLANSGEMTGGPGFQVAIGRFLDRVFGRIEHWTAGTPEWLLGLAVLTLAAAFVVATRAADDQVGVGRHARCGDSDGGHAGCAAHETEALFDGVASPPMTA